MRTRELIRQLRKLGASEAEISSTLDAAELKQMLAAYSGVDSVLDAPFSWKDFVLDNQYILMGVIVGIVLLYALSFKLNVVELLIPKGRTQAIIKHIATFFVAGEIVLAFVLIVELILEWYVSWTRVSALLSWILPNDTASRRYLAPMIYFPLSMDPKNQMMNIGPMITLWLCRQVSLKLSAYVDSEVSNRDITLPEKCKKKRIIPKKNSSDSE